MKTIAEGTVWRGRDGEARKRLIVKVGCPIQERTKNHDFGCMVQFSGIGIKKYINGVDSLQALMLATVFINQEIDRQLNSGYSFYYSKNDIETHDLKLIWRADGREYERIYNERCRTRRCSRRSGLSRSVRGTARAIPSRG